MINTIWIDNLIKVLEYEKNLYLKLLSIAEERTGMVINNELENLQASIVKEQKLAADLKQLQDVREQILKQVAISVGKKPEEITISDLVRAIPEDHAARLSKIRDKLSENIQKLSDKNSLNQKLIQNALDYVDFSINLLTQPTPQVTQYGRKGNETGAKSRGVLDIKY